MGSHNGCEAGCTSTRHEMDCKVAHPGEEARLREALRRIAEHGNYPCGHGDTFGCVNEVREIALEALR